MAFSSRFGCSEVVVLDDISSVADDNDTSLVGSTVENRVTLSGRSLKRRKLTSWIHEHFSVQNSKRVCRHCLQSDYNKPATYSMNSGNSMELHLRDKHRLRKDEGTVGDPPQATLNCDGRLNLYNQMSDDAKEHALKALTEFIVDQKESFFVVDKESFHTFCRSLNKWYTPPSRQTLVRSVLQDLYVTAQRRFVRELQNIPGRVALTLDGWSSRGMRGYLVVTIHWIDRSKDSWKLRSSILEFVFFPPPHNTETTSDLLLKNLEDYNL